MFKLKSSQMSFVSCFVEKRTRKNTFFQQINLLIDWSEIEKEITKVYVRGHSVSGRPAYTCTAYKVRGSGLLLFTRTSYVVQVRCF